MQNTKKPLNTNIYKQAVTTRITMNNRLSIAPASEDTLHKGVVTTVTRLRFDRRATPSRQTRKLRGSRVAVVTSA